MCTAALGPSVAQPPVGPHTALPPYALDAHPGPWVVIGLLGAAILTGGASLGAGMAALRRGWLPPVGRLLYGSGLACLALVIVPPMGSADQLSYAAYGRLAATGHDPYVMTPGDLTAMHDPIGAAVEPTWAGTSSVYGPVATGEQALASYLGGTSVRHTVLVLAALNAVAFLLAGWLLVRAGRGDPQRQARAAVLWAVNPLLLYAGVSGAHVDVVMVAFLVGALVTVRRSPVLAGVLLGLAAAVKLPAAVGAAGIGWALRRRPRALLVAGGAALVVFAGLYALAGPHAFDQAYRASRYVSLATPGHLLLVTLRPVMGNEPAHLVLRYAGLAALVAMTVLLLRWAHRRFDAFRQTPDETVDRQRLAAWVVAAFGLGWLFTTPYALPWYDAFGWALLAFLPASRLDALFLLRGVVLALAYVPGRAVLPADVAAVTLGFRREVVPWATLALLVAAVVVAARAARAPLPASGGGVSP